jgi:hypothetical protein
VKALSWSSWFMSSPGEKTGGAIDRGKKLRHHYS